MLASHTYTYSTCVFPPVASCRADLDNDPDALKHEKNAPMPFINPKAKNSWMYMLHM